MIPFKPELNSTDEALLHKMRLERFKMRVVDPKWYKSDLQDSVLILEALSPVYIDMAIKGFSPLMDAAHIILGANSISLYFSQEWIADYYKDGNVCGQMLYPQNFRSITNTRDFDMSMATLEREATEQISNGVNNEESPTQNNDYISLDQLRAMAVEISGENEELIAWMEQNGVSIPVRFFNGVPRYQTKAIFKCATDWNNWKIQSAMSRYLGTSSTSNNVMPVEASNGVHPTGEKELKLLRTPSGFKPVKSGKDKYVKTVRALVEALPHDRQNEYLSHILEQSQIGTAFLTRMSKQFDDKDAFARLLEAFQDHAGADKEEQPAAA